MVLVIGELSWRKKVLLMCKDDLKKYMLLKKEDGEEVSIYRVLELVEEKVLVIDCMKKVMPVWKKVEDFKTYVEVEEDVKKDSLVAIEDMNTADKKVAYQRYNMISCIIPFIANETMRTQAIKKVAEDNQLSIQSIRKYLCEYLATMNIGSLAPKQREEKALTIDEKNMRKSLNRWYYTTKKRTLKNCYTLMLQHFYCDEEGKLFEEYPSYYQFRYFYRKYNKKETEYISRNGLSYYQRNQRPLVGNGVQSFAQTIGMGMLDATVCDIYLVNESGDIVGRPILTLCVDAYSGIVCGYSLSWEGGVYSLRNLMLNVISDKVEHCKAFGIEINEEQWPSHQLPLKLVTDQGSEYKGETFAQIIDLGVELLNLQSFRADEKGPVEQCFNAIQNYFKPILKGKGVIEVDFQERGARDYRKDACLTMNDFEKVILNCIVFYNSNRVLDRFPFTEDMLEAEVKPIPCYVWKWACEQLGANLRDVSKEDLIRVLLPRTKGKFGRNGLYVNGLHYHNPLFREEYLQGKECEVAYDMDSSNHIWLIENGKYIQFDLIESRFMGKGLDDVTLMKSKQRELVKREAQQKTQAEVDLAKAIQLIANSATINTQPSTKGIRNNRQREQIKTHKKYAGEVVANG